MASVVVTAVLASLIGVAWPAGLIVVVLGGALVSGLVWGYLSVFIAFLAIRSSLDAFTGSGVGLGRMVLNVPAAAAIFLLLFAGLHRIQASRKGQARPLSRLERVFAYWLAFLALCVGLGVSHFGDWGVGIREWTRLASIGAVLYLAACFASEGYAWRVMRGVQLALPIPLLVTLWQWMSGSAPILGGVARARGTFYHPITLSVFMVLFMGITLWRIVEGRHRIAWMVVLALEGIAMISAYSLTALALIGVVVGALVVRLRGRRRVAAVAGGAALVLGFALSSAGTQRLVELRYTGSIQRTIETNRSTNSLSWRVWHWWRLWQASRPYRWTGAGLGTTDSYVSPIGYAAHNDILRMLVETGPAGMMLYLVLLLALLRVFKLGPETGGINSISPYMRAVVVGLLVVSFFDNINSATAVQYYLWCVAGLVLGSQEWERSRLGAGSPVQSTPPALPKLLDG